MNRLILCADDYAIAPGVSAAILRLLEAGRISATSCMVVSPFWPEQAARLRPYAGRADIGLHLTLTGGVPLATLMRRAMLRQLDPGEIAGEIARQIDAFTAAFGQPPDFVDGHQHVHQLPVVREALTGLWHDRLGGGRTWLRVCDDAVPAILRRRVATAKSLLIGSFGRRLRRLARRTGIPVNNRFSGIHDFSGRIPYSVLFERFIAGAKDHMVVMCHPGLSDDALRRVDPVTTAREEELRFFESPAFPLLLAKHGLALGRFF